MKPFQELSGVQNRKFVQKPNKPISEKSSMVFTEGRNSNFDNHTDEL